MRISIDGEIVPPERAMISVLDRGLLYGDGLFEVLRSWDGQVPTLDEHLDRLYASAAVLQLRVIERTMLRTAVLRTIAAAEVGDHRVRIVVTRGPGPLSARLADLGPGGAIVFVEPLPEQPPEIALAWGGHDLPKGPRRHKTLSYLDAVFAREIATAFGADDAIRLDHNGDVAECATANLFAVLVLDRDEPAVVTPGLDGGALPGITRARVLALCGRLGIRAEERRLPPTDVMIADELFVTSALRGVVPVTKLVPGGSLRVGEVTKRIVAAYAQEMRALI